VRMMTGAASGGRAGVRVATAGVGLLLLATVLSGCETTADKSARLEKAAKHTRIAEEGLSITKASVDVKVVSALLVRGTEGAAAVVTLRDDSGHALRNVPIAITVRNARGGTLFQNDAPGLEAALTAVASLPAHGEVTWVNDQVPASGDPTSVSAIVGAARAASAGIPQLEVQDIHASEESAGSVGAAGAVKNRSKVTQQNLVVYALARRMGTVVAAGRAVLPEVPPGASVPFQAFFQGATKGAQLEASAPATTLG
jgi:hypothetical protein